LSHVFAFSFKFTQHTTRGLTIAPHTPECGSRGPGYPYPLDSANRCSIAADLIEGKEAQLEPSVGE